MCNLIFPVGIPGSGKSTWAKEILGHGKYSIVSSDDIRRQKWGSLRAAHDVTPEEKAKRNGEVWDIFYRKVEDRLTHNVDTYADGTNLTKRARNRLIDISAKTGADLHVVVFDNIIQAVQRNEEREYDQIVPKDVMDKFCTNYRESHWEIFGGDEEGSYTSVTVIGHLE